MTDELASNRLGLLKVSMELLCDVLHLPKGTSIHNVQANVCHGYVELKISSPEFHELQNGQIIPVVNLEVTSANHTFVTGSKWIYPKLN